MPRKTEPKLVAVRRGSGHSVSAGFAMCPKSKPIRHRKKAGKIDFKKIGSMAWKGTQSVAELTAKLAPIIVPLALKYLAKGAGHRRKGAGRRKNIPSNAIAYY